ncbi:MAG: ATP-binding protein, partial [Myxococcota bacterium]
ELRTPMSLITLALADIQRHEHEGLSERSVARMNEIQGSVDQLLALVDELLLLAAGDSGQLRLSLERLQLDALIERTVSPWQPAAAQAGLELEIEPISGEIQLDPVAFQRIVNNLLSNALKFTPAGGRIRFSAREKEAGVELSVVDTGPGLSEGFLERVFGRFEQDTSSQGIARGSGIGLAIVKELAQAHGGDVHAENAAEGGAAFRVWFPWETSVASVDGGTRVTPTSTPEVPSAPEEAPVAPASSGAEGVILLAEDDPQLRGYIQEILSERFTVVAASNGVEALELATSAAPDLLLTDVQMPHMDGFELAEAYRALPNHRLSPVVFITASHNVPSQLRGFAAGAVDFIAKPFSPELLIARVEAQMSIRRMALRLLEREKLAELGFLTSGLAHELRNPANVVANAAELLSGDGADSPELFGVMRDSARQIGALCEKLLGITRSELIGSAEFEMSEIVRVARSTTSSLVGARQLEIKLPETLRVTGSRALLSQALAVLLDNSAKATPEDGRITIHGFEQDGEVVVEVSDSGPGVPLELRERIFAPFFTTREAGQGTGLGLPLARSIAVQHGGTLRVEPHPHGTAFRLALPLDS